MIVIPIVDTATSLFPWHLFDSRWRFGAVGMLSNALLIPTSGLLVAFVTALVLNHNPVRRTIGIFGFVAAGLCVVALGMFALDSLQTRAVVRPEMRLSFNVAAITAALKTLLAGVTYLAFGWAGVLAGAKPAAGGVPLMPTPGERAGKPR